MTPRCLFQRGNEKGMVVDGFGQLVAAGADVGRGRTAEDWAGADDGDLDDEIVEDAGLRLEHSLDLGAAFDLEGADRVADADHLEDGLVLQVDPAQVRDRIAGGRDQVHTFLDQREHPEGEEVDLDEAGVVAGVLVPLAEVAVLHRGRLDRHQAGDRLGGDDHAAGVLGDVAREAGQLLGQVDQVGPGRDVLAGGIGGNPLQLLGELGGGALAR